MSLPVHWWSKPLKGHPRPLVMQVTTCVTKTSQLLSSSDSFSLFRSPPPFATLIDHYFLSSAQIRPAPLGNSWLSSFIFYSLFGIVSHKSSTFYDKILKKKIFLSDNFPFFCNFFLVIYFLNYFNPACELLSTRFDYFTHSLFINCSILFVDVMMHHFRNLSLLDISLQLPIPIYDWT